MRVIFSLLLVCSSAFSQAPVTVPLRKLLDRPIVALAPEAVAEPMKEGSLIIEKLRFFSEAGERVPTLIVRPDAPGKRPAVIVLHGTGGNKESMKSWLTDLANQGFVAIAIDARYHGDRSGGAKGAAAYVAAITEAWRTPMGKPQPHPWYYDTVWDIWRLLDYLGTRPDVDAGKIGMIGTSMGGIQTWLASEDERIRVVMPLIAVQSFRWSLENERWQGRAKTIQAAHEAAAKDLGESAVNAKVCKALWTKLIPGILDEYDCPQMLAKLAGRPLLIANGDRDPNCPIEGAKLAIASAEKVFAKAGCPEKLKVIIGKDVAHQVTAEARRETVAWCVRWLK